MNQEQREAYEAKHKREAQAQWVVANCVCAICGAKFIDPYDPEVGEIVAQCSKDKSHRGFEKVPSYQELHERGVGLPLHIVNKLKVRERRK